MKKFVAGFLVCLLLLLLLFLGGMQGLVGLYTPARVQTEQGVAYGARVQGKEFQTYTPSAGWQTTFVAGVNIGLGAPGRFPGELGIEKEDYLRWFRQIGEMNANTIRVYTAQTPEFYEALAQHNRFATRPLYLIQEVYVDEEDVLEYMDVYANNGKIKGDFQAAARELADILHGNAQIPQRPGHAWGTYTADVSEYVIGWILGVEWEPELVEGTNEANPEKTAFSGEYVYTQNASPFEVFLAESAEDLIAYQTETYATQAPMAFCNWVTTDPLDHPNEPNAGDDGESVDTEHIRATDRFAPGLFASYHIYPYYPESLNYQADYVATGNPYRAYLDELNAYHTMPVLVAEVGSPASRGRTHQQPTHGYHQGHIDETEQGGILDTLLREIQDADYMGALVFSWQDEWFKYTWNTMDLDDASRRPYWPDYQTSEQNFGLLAFDPGEKTTAAVVDGKIKEWAGETPLVETEEAKVYLRNDEGWLYLRVDTDSFGREPLYIGLDTIPGQGISTYEGYDLGCEADFLLILDGPENSRLLVDAYYDPTYFNYAVIAGQLPRQPQREEKGAGFFVPVTQVLTRRMEIPGTGGVVPFTTFDTGRLTPGVADPKDPNYSSLADICGGEGTVELRLPYLMLNISDPSTGLILDDFYDRGGFVSTQGDGIGVGLAGASGRYRWDYWENSPTYHERLKPAYYALTETFSSLSPGGRENWVHRFLTAFRDPVMLVLGLIIFLLLSLTIYFFLVLLYVHVRGILRTKRMERLKRRAAEGAQGTDRSLRTGGGLLAAAQLLHQARPGELLEIRSLIAQPAFLAFLERKMAGRDLPQKILAMDLVGSGGLRPLAAPVAGLLREEERQEVQYHGLLALARLGEGGRLVALCKRANLSYRSLLEIFSVYTGDKPSFYRAMLDARDPYMVRISVKQIGQEGLTQFAPQVLELLDRADFALCLDVVRTLGQLEWKPAGEVVASLLGDGRWELRSVAVTALGRMDAQGYLRDLEQALGDEEWQVRFNAAAALAELPQREEILRRATASGDRYAAEILTYMIDQSQGKEAASYV